MLTGFRIMQREEKILYHINMDGQGIEIGPSHSPIVPKKDGHKVHVIDHMNREQLIEKYTGHDVQLENIEEVDFVWSGQPFAELTGKAGYYDWIIASHIIEHTTDFIGFLNDCDSIMKDDVVISLVIPYKRFCFDHFRANAGISEIINAHIHKSAIHSPGAVAEFYLNFVSKGGQIGWDYLKEGEYDLVHSVDKVRAEIARAMGKKVYIDIHAWCFTPHSFRLIIHDLNSLGLVTFKEISFFPTAGNEFYVTLGRQGEGPGLSRMDMLKKIEEELEETENKKYIEELKESERKLSEATREIERIHDSTSWKVTRPLRELRLVPGRLSRLFKKSP